MIYKTKESINGIIGLKLVFFTDEYHQSQHTLRTTEILQDCDINYRLVYIMNGYTYNSSGNSAKSFKVFIIPENNTEENIEKIYSYFFVDKLKKE